MEIVTRELRLMQTDINYLVAKLEEIHSDVKQLQIHVDELRQESSGRKAVQRLLLVAAGGLGAVMGWVIAIVK